MSRPIIEFDVETTGLQWYAYELGTVQFYSPELGIDEFHWHDPASRDRIQEVLDMDADFRAWNSKFDLHFLEEAGYRLPSPDRWHDGMVAAVLLDENAPGGLKPRHEAIFGKGSREWETKLKDWIKEENKRRRKRSKETGEAFVPANYIDVPEEILRPYAMEDVYLTRQLGEVQDAALAATPELLELYRIEMKVMAALYKAERHGLPIDRDAALRLEMGLALELNALEERARELAGIDTFNPRSSQQLYATLKRLGADLQFVTGTSMDAENLATVDHELARIVERHRGVAKMLGTYISPMLRGTWTTTNGMPWFRHPYIDDKNRLHSTIRQVGARTGRMSSAEPNIQNLPRDDLRIRYLVRAEPGNKLVTGDLDAVEMKLFAAFAGRGEMLDAMRDPSRDPHTETADLLYLEDFERAGGHVEDRRQRGKKWNYSMLYGGGLRTIRKNFRVSQKKARQMLDKYHAKYPEIGRLQRTIEYALYDRGFVKTPFNRRLRAQPRDAYKLVNWLVQGTAADVLKVAIARLEDEGIEIIAPIHDEILAMVREEDAERVAAAIQQALVDHPVINALVPLGAEVKIVDRWSDAKKPGYVPEILMEEAHA